MSKLCEQLGREAAEGGARPGRCQREDAELAAPIALAHQRSCKIHGASWIVEDLRQEGTPISKRRCARLMKPSRQLLRAAELAVFDHIETFYNPRRRHSSLGYLSPVAFEKQQTKNDITAA